MDLSRREFLKLCGATALLAGFPSIGKIQMDKELFNKAYKKGVHYIVPEEITPSRLNTWQEVDVAKHIGDTAIAVVVCHDDKTHVAEYRMTRTENGVLEINRKAIEQKYHLVGCVVE